ncbi:hypothetical protein BP6252_05470 [Coleophoma cylindrospora]|uniref:DUF7704 domain-containing protein n=1 Tax=Coleophoma cylindrospora TaxID=1849047 RepID=A0A3D8RTJ8_9HELO|nr:hypothetical protein BP6252_05470 [Coleophoma cylindrospora]
MASIFAPIPKFVFTVFEPISLIAGAVAPFISPSWFIAEQIPMTKASNVTDNSRMVALQLGNVYALLAMVGIAVLYTTTEAKVVRNYVIALWIADIGHVAATYYVLGYETFMDIANWNAMTWGNVGATAFLFLTRTLYLMGVLGADRKPALPQIGKKAQ